MHEQSWAGKMKNLLCTCEDGPLTVNCSHQVGFITDRFTATRHLLTMPPRRKLTTFNRARAIAWLQDGVGKREVARRLQVSSSVIVRLHQRYQATHSVLERPRSGRPKKTTPRQDCYIQHQALQEPKATANTIRGRLRAATNVNVSLSTVRNRLHDVGLRGRRPAVRPRLTADHRRSRLAFCRRHSRWTRQQWGQVLFSDESRFNLLHADGRGRVWRRQGERYNDGKVQEKTAFGGGSVMVWGGLQSSSQDPSVPREWQLDRPSLQGRDCRPSGLASSAAD